MPLSRVQIKQLTQFIQKKSTATNPEQLQNLTTEELINFEVQIRSDDPRMEFAYSGPVLCVLIHSRNKKLAEAVINEGADLNTLDSSGHSALFYALLQQDKDLAVLLAQRGVTTDTVPYHTITDAGDDPMSTLKVPTEIISNIILRNDKDSYRELEKISQDAEDAANFLREVLGNTEDYNSD